MTIFYIIILIIVVIFGIGIGYEFISSLRDKNKYKTPPGELVHVGGHDLHILIMGERQADQPVIVLDAGVGSNSLDWQKVQPQIAEFAQVVSYDRAGYGWSETSTIPRTPERIVHELHELLDNALVPPPYLLVGHSFGGIYSRLFLETYPDDVVGLVLVESSHPDMLAARNTEPEIQRLKNVRRFQRFGIVRLMLPRILNRANHLEGEAFDQYVAFNLMDNANTLREAVPLFRDGIELPETISVPLTIVSRQRDNDIATEKSWGEYQDKLAELSPDAVHIHTRSSSHWSALAEPDTVVAAIRTMFENVQTY